MMSDIDSRMDAPVSMKVEEQAKLLMEAWKKAVEVQAHFNDIELRIRNLALSILGAVVAFVKALDLAPGSHSVASASQGFLFLALAVVIAAFWFMDKHWYHRLLVGAVAEGGALEEKLTRLGVPVSLGKNIGRNSPFVFHCRWLPALHGRSMRSADKIDLFYNILGTLCVVAAGISFGWHSFGVFVLLIGGVWWRWCTRLPTPDTRLAHLTTSAISGNKAPDHASAA